MKAISLVVGLLFALCMGSSVAFLSVAAQRQRNTHHFLEAPAITMEDLTCSHDGGDTWQLRDVSYMLQRGSSE